MNLRHMEVFRAVMLSGSVRGAANLLHVSEPAASKLLAVAETKSGCRLFERIKGRLVATPEAHLLYEEVERVWKGVERVHHLADRLAGSQSGSLHIAVTPSLATSLVPRAVAKVLSQKSQVDLKVVLLPPNQLVRALVEGDFQVGIALQCAGHPNLESVARIPCGLVCVIAADHPLASRKRVTAKDLAGERIISYPELSGVIAAELAGRHMDLELRSGPAACWFARAGVGVALVDSAVVANEGIDVQWRPFQTRESLIIEVLVNAASPLSGLARDLVRELQFVAAQSLK